MTLKYEDISSKDTERFFSKITRKNGCWEWNGCKSKGYGCFSSNGKPIQAHRFSFLLSNKKLTKGLEVHHVCDNKCCVNPSHLKEITHKENTLLSNACSAICARKTECKRGHEFNEKNSYVYKKKDGGLERRCKICLQNRNRNYCASWRRKHLKDSLKEAL
jgi:hypothetical protein